MVMKRMTVGLTVLLAGLFITSAASGQDIRNLQAMMIMAQHEMAPMDRRLERVEYKLRRVFQFPYYRYVGEGRIALSPGAEGTIRLPDDHELKVKAGNKGRVEVRWTQREKPLLSTSVSVSRNAPVVLGGVPEGEGTLILVLTEP
jgi:hypothetical protein